MSEFRNRIKTYDEITNYSVIARRYFVNNFYDGNLTILGSLLGTFVLIFSQGTVPSAYVLLTGIGVAISMFFSGFSGSYLSERAEQKKTQADLAKAMGLQEEGEDAVEESDISTQEEELKKAMLKKKIRLKRSTIKTKRRKKTKTLHERAERFAGIVVALVNGGAPLLGGMIPLVPFFFVHEANIVVYLVSFIIILASIICLGIYLGRLSKESILKNILQMLIAFALTITVSILILLMIPPGP